MASRFTQSMKAKDRAARKVPGRNAGTIGIRSHVATNPDRYMGNMDFDFSSGGFIPSEAAQERDANRKLYGTPNGKKPAVCGRCNMAIPAAFTAYGCQEC